MTLPPVECVDSFLSEAQRLGVEVRWKTTNMQHLDAAYHALPGTPGRIVLHDVKPRPNLEKQCILLTHEMVHVLQHWKGQLQSIPPLGWPTENAPPGRELSQQEREAYSAQNDPKKVLNAIKTLQPYSYHVLE